MKDGYTNGKSAMTLVEVAVSSALLLMAMAAFITAFVQSRRSAAIADINLKAVHTARQTMETLLSYPFNATQLNAGSHSTDSGYYTVSNNAALSVKDITLVTRWINPLSGGTSFFTLAGSMSSELHQ